MIKRTLPILLLMLPSLAWGQIEMNREVKNGFYIVKVKNELPADIRLIINDSLSINISADDNFREVLQIRLNPDQDTTGVLDKYSFVIRLGDGRAAHNDRYAYALPFAKGKAYEVIQGFRGSFSHRKKTSLYAVDFRMPVGDTVCAAREGIVVWTEGRYDSGGNDMKYIDEANRVMIMHDDGTVALYNHLLKDGILVQIGQTVSRGTPVALSGNSGYSTTPHLHFAIIENDESIPFRFKKYQRAPRKGKMYRNRDKTQ